MRDDLTDQAMHVQRAVDIVGSQRKLASKISFTQQYVSALIQKKLKCSSEAALKIHRATKGKVSRSDLRPDLYPPRKRKEVSA